jgi:hypothetical protein
MTLYKFPAAVIAVLALLTACDKKKDLQLGDRKAVAAEFRLKAVVNEKNDTVERYQYTTDKRMEWLMVRSEDRYVFQYSTGTTLPTGMNDIRLDYNGQQLVKITGKRVVANIGYPEPGRIVVYQVRYPLIPAQPPVYDTVVFSRNNTGNIISAAFSPAGMVASFSYDNNPIAYTNIQSWLLPVLLQYPLAQVAPQLAGLLSGHNVLRYTLGRGITAGEVPSLNTEDYSYRFDQQQYDVPTMQEQHTVAATNRHYFLYY